VTGRARVVRVLGFHGVATQIARQTLGFSDDHAVLVAFDGGVRLHHGIVAVGTDYFSEGGGR
jgi:hypothetical protein